MANLSKYAKQRIVSLKESGLTSREVVEALKREGATVIRVTTQVVRRCHKRYLQTGSIERRKGSERPTLRNSALLNTIEDVMQADDEATAVQIRSYLLRHGHGLLSLSTILRGRLELGWTYRGSAYCQLIRQANNDLNGLELTFRTTLRMSCGPMKRPYSLSAIRDSAAGRQANDPAQSLVPSIQSRCMCGQELDGMESPKSVFLTV